MIFRLLILFFILIPLYCYASGTAGTGTGTSLTSSGGGGGNYNAAAVAITGGTIDGTAIGGTTSSTALFSTATIGTAIIGGQNLFNMQPGFGGRLTLTSATPVTTVDATGQTTLFYAPYKNCYVPINNGTNVAYYNFCASATDAVGLSLALDPATGHTNYHQSGKAFDAFVGLNSATVTLCTGPAWTTATGGSANRGTGAGTTELQMYNGMWTNKNSMTCRFGSASGNTFTCAVNQCTYLGSFYTYSNSNSPALNTTITAGTTAIVLAATLTGVGVGEQYYALLSSSTGTEEVLVTAGFGTTALTVTRAQRGTVAATYANATTTVTADNAQTGMQYAMAASITGGTSNLLGVWNAYNQVESNAQEYDLLPSQIYTTGAYQPWLGSNMNRISFIDGLGTSAVNASDAMTLSTTSGTSFGAIGYNTSTTNSSTIVNSLGTANAITNTVILMKPGLLGLSFVTPVEFGQAGSNFFGSFNNMTLMIYGFNN